MKNGQRILKYQGKITSVLLIIFIFSLFKVAGNVPLHEWNTQNDQSNELINEQGIAEHITPENLITWVFEDGTFIPMAKLPGEKCYCIITDHLGTPVES